MSGEVVSGEVTSVSSTGSFFGGFLSVFVTDSLGYQCGGHMALKKEYIRDGNRRIAGSVTSGYSDESTVVRNEHNRIVARELLKEGSAGIVKPSVRHNSGTC